MILLLEILLGLVVLSLTGFFVVAMVKIFLTREWR